MRSRTSGFIAAVLLWSCAVWGETSDDLNAVVRGLQTELARQRVQIEAQQQQLDALRTALDAAAPAQRADAAEPAAPSVAEVPARADSDAYGVYAEHEKDEAHERSVPGRIDFSGYGVVNYYDFDWDTDPERRDAIDVERFILALTTPLSQSVELDAEIELEHGGTGATMEFDPFEEFGEFEQEIEKGGEVELEELSLEFEHSEAFKWRIGHFIVPVGTINPAHRPADYFTVQRSESEAAVIPQLWHETGVAQFGRVGNARYEVQLVNGLDSTGFSSANWVAPGLQQRFEMINAEDFAVVGRVDYEFLEDVSVGASGYYGKSGDNRPKDDLDADAPVSIYDVHASVRRGPWTLRALYMAGHLGDSEAITLANRNLSNNLNVKRTPVASDAEAAFIEIGYDVAPFARRFIPERWMAGRLDLYVRYDDYDSMADVEGSVFDNPRWDRQAWTTGWSYQPHPSYLFKGEYSHRELGIDTLNDEDTVAVGMGFVF